MINYTFGILSSSVNPTPNMTGYRYSDAKPTEAQRKSIAKLIPYTGEDGLLAVDFYIKLLKSSPHWTDYEPKYDPKNTYSTSVAPTSSSQQARLHIGDDMVSWDNNTGVTSQDFPYSRLDPLLDRVCAKLFSVLAGV